MNISKELIQAFFSHQCTPEEAQKVADYLKANPDVAEEYLPVQDWKESNLQTLLPETFWDKQWGGIKKSENRGRVVMLLKRVAVAAILLLAVGASIFYFNESVTQPRPEISETTQEFKTITNNHDDVLGVSLSDGSFVELSPGAAITYKDGFETASRDVVLKGEAVFSVAKDKDRPFTVYSGNISTTALGTKFRVVYDGNSAKTKVYLYEGKVVVKSAQAKNKKESYLMPGDMLSYNDNIVKVTREGKELIAVAQKADGNKISVLPMDKKEEVKSVHQISGQITAIPNWYRFEKESVANVFDQLASLYNVKIEYDVEKLQNKYFIGRFEKDKTIDHILKTIAELNHLKVEKVDEGHFIIK